MDLEATLALYLITIMPSCRNEYHLVHTLSRYFGILSISGLIEVLTSQELISVRYIQRLSYFEPTPKGQAYLAAHLGALKERVKMEFESNGVLDKLFE